MIFDSVIRAAIQDLGDFCPLIVNHPVHQKQNPLLLSGPVYLLDPWIEVVVPPFATLLAHPARKVLCYRGPALGSVLFYQLKNSPVFFFGPGSFDQ